MTQAKKHITCANRSPWKGGNLPIGHGTFTVKTETPKNLTLIQQATEGAKVTKSMREHFEQMLQESGNAENILTMGPAKSSGTFTVIGDKETIKSIVDEIPDLELCE